MAKPLSSEMAEFYSQIFLAAWPTEGHGPPHKLGNVSLAPKVCKSLTPETNPN